MKSGNKTLGFNKIYTDYTVENVKESIPLIYNLNRLTSNEHQGQLWFSLKIN